MFVVSCDSSEEKRFKNKKILKQPDRLTIMKSQEKRISRKEERTFVYIYHGGREGGIKGGCGWFSYSLFRTFKNAKYLMEPRENHMQKFPFRSKKHRHLVIDTRSRA